MSQPDFENLLKEAMGLDVASIGSSTLERAVKSRMTTLGIEEAGCYWEYLQGSSEEVQELIESVVVPETWFFRDREAFSAMARLVSASTRAVSLGPPLRVLSVPCCTGEESYSIAIALAETGVPHARIQVDGVDVSRQAIVRAKRGVYGSNSFRGEDLGFRDRYFERSGNVHSVPQWLRRLVTFHHENLLSGSFRIDATPYDIIFCRNLLIYFDRTKQEAAMEKLNHLLKPDGYLFVGPAEAVLASRSGFKPVNQSMSFAFSKQRKDCLPKELPSRLPLKAHRDAPLPASRKKSAVLIPEILTLRKTESSPVGAPAVDVEQIKTLADAGQFEEATALCERYLEEKGPAFEVYYLLALINDARGESERAMECYRKALYLSPDDSDVLMHMAFLHERRGDAASAKRLRDRALRSEASQHRIGEAGETVFRSKQ